MQSGNSEALRSWLPAVLAAGGFLLDLAAFWPGHLSFDSAYAWWQAGGGTTSNIVPPAYVLALRASRAFGGGPGPLLAFQSLLFWGGLGLVAHALRLSAPRAVLLLALVGLAPVAWLLRAHLWTDVALFSALLFATGLLLTAQTRNRRFLLVVALPALAWAAALRHNALPAVLPFVLWWAGLALRRPAPAPHRLQTLLLAAGVFTVLALAGPLLERSVDQRIVMWPSLAQFDLAGISLQTDRMLLPEFMIGEDLDVAELRAAFRPWSNVAMLQGTRSGMSDPFLLAWQPGQLAALRTAWFRATIGHPLAWLRHRAEVTHALVGTHPADWPPTLVYADAPVGYAGEAPVPHNAGILHRTILAAAARLRATPLLAAWPCLLLGLIALPLAWRRRRGDGSRTAILLLASAWLYALPLALLAPSAELRYLGWPCIASLLAFVCASLPAAAAPTHAGEARLC